MIREHAPVIVVRGGGDIATGTIYALHESGFRVLVLETERPTAIRRHVAFSEAAVAGLSRVENVTCRRVDDVSALDHVWAAGEIPLLVDEKASCLETVKPAMLVDAILAKRNLGTTRLMAPVTVGLGPGFTAGEDVDYVIETMRGHGLGRIITRGAALPNTGVPGLVGGIGKERVIHAPASGTLRVIRDIADLVQAGEPIAEILAATDDDTTDAVTIVRAPISGVLRGMLPAGFDVPKGMKMADIDPRLSERDNCFTISDKARCIAGSVLLLAVRHTLLT